ncbi:IS5 family transposase (plasmid) [Sphingobium yanoikuyae]|uniref:IS5 family transposase n=1 Tax=Sphingobium yanoikuyae TaxID=13690 RepID=A0A6P1GS71_SPHYA|nr:IS5 family transposase [Sphingobium yanoikuyae]QHD70732.1 IS5 family transposase [Sphingobium yanoikuyae]
MDPKSLFSLNDHLEMLSRHGDPLEMLERTVDFEYFRAWLVEGLGYGDGGKGGRPPFDPVAMFKILILQAQHNLSDARMEYMIRDRLSWMRFLGFALGDRTPDENTIRHFRNRMTETGTLKRVMKAFDWQLHKKGYIPMSGQIIDASLVPAPKQRNTDGERQAIKDGKSAQDIWPDDPAKAAQKDTDARWTLKIGGKVRYKDGKPLPMIALPVFGYKSHISIDRRYGFIRAGEVTSAAHADGRMLRHVIAENSSSEVWADTAYRSRTNETWLADRMLTSRIHRRKPKGKSMPRATARANAAKSTIRARVEHVFAHQKNRFGLFIRTIGIKRAEAKLTLANLAYNWTPRRTAGFGPRVDGAD